MGEVRFIRRGGRVIPIRSDGGADLRAKGSRKGVTMAKIRKASNEAEKHSKFSTGDKIKMGTSLAIGGAFFGATVGAALGGTAGLAAKGILKLAGSARKFSAGKVAAETAGILGIGLGVGMGISGYQMKGMVRNRQYNKAMGKQLAKRKTSV